MPGRRARILDGCAYAKQCSNIISAAILKWPLGHLSGLYWIFI